MNKAVTFGLLCVVIISLVPSDAKTCSIKKKKLTKKVCELNDQVSWLKGAFEEHVKKAKADTTSRLNEMETLVKDLTAAVNALEEKEADTTSRLNETLVNNRTGVVNAHEEKGPIVEGWATNVVHYSSQYADNSGATTILGEPDVYPSYGDLINAWAPRNVGQQDWIEVEFAVSMYVQRIDIYETYNSGGVSSIEVWDGSTYHSVYTGTVQKIEKSRIFSPAIQEKNFPTNRIRVSTDGSVSLSWVELDAIKMVGRRAT